MDERFTDRARRALALANHEAQRLNHDYIGTEHILLGLVKDGSGSGVHILKSLGVDLNEVGATIERLVPRGSAPVALARLPQTPRAKRAARRRAPTRREPRRSRLP